MNLTRDAALTLIAAQAAFQLYIGKVRTSERRKMRKFVDRKVLMNSGMAAVKAKAAAACRSIGIEEEEIEQAMNDAMDRHLRKKKLNKEEVRQIVSRPAPINAAPLG